MAKFVLIALLVAGVMIMLRLRRRSAVNPWTKDAVTPNSGSTYGTLNSYFDKIAEFDGGDYDGFFVTASAVGSDHILQMSAGADQGGAKYYEFDMPLTQWSRVHADAIEAEARKQSIEPVRNEGGGMGFLDVGFPTLDGHRQFASWVAHDVFDLPQGTQFEITWG